ncbi:MAG: hypothetical protein EHM33_19505 [Chloroflexi bacterium]|nr:MAG: hypothetical protein EHM33_19505 [Chloroflexota bacterium]
MKSKRLFQIFVLLTLLFTPFGNEQFARASASSVDRLDLLPIQRNSPAFQDITQVPPIVYTVVNPLSVNVGEAAIATVNLNSVPADGYASIELTCSYDPGLLEASSITIANLFGEDPVVAINGPQDGRFIVAIAGSHGNKATSDGAVIAFNVRGLQAGQTALNCKARVSWTGSQLINIYSVPASVTILGDPLTPTIVPASCDKVDFVADISVPPGTVMSPGATFTKTWRLANVGSCTWTPSYQLVFFSGEQMGAVSSAQFTGYVAPGQIANFSLNMTAPSTPGSYRGYWMFKNANGTLFGAGSQANQPWFVDIVVSHASTLTPTFTNTPSVTPNEPTNSPTPSITPGGPTATPIPGVVYDFASQACAAVWYSGAGQLPCPGINGDSKGFVLKVDNPRLETGAIDTRPGLLTFPQNVQNGYIQGFYPPFHVQNGDHFRSMIGCEGGATSCYVAFRLDYQTGTEAIKTFWGPWLERYDGQNFSADVDLSPLAGKDVKFILTVLSAGVATGDYALWVGPVVSRTGTIATPTSTHFIGSPTPTLSATPGEPPVSTATPTSTPVESPTPAPEDYGTLTGQVLAGKLVTVSSYDANNTLVSAVEAQMDGSFNLIIPAGIYTISARAEGFLSAQGSGVVSAGNSSTMPTISLLAGDIDGNNVIDQFDALTIGMSYNMAVPAAADLNNDRTINVLDLELLAKNYRKTGPVTWQ